MRLGDPCAVQLHTFYTLRGLQQRGHQAILLALYGRRVLCTGDLNLFRADALPGSYFARLGLSARLPFRALESGLRRAQTSLGSPYLALFDSYRVLEACCKNLPGYDVIHERYNLLGIGGALASRKLGIPYFLEVNADLLEQRRFKGAPEMGLRRLCAVWGTRLCLKSATRIMCVSSELKGHLHNGWDVADNKLVVLPCAADVAAFGAACDSAPVRHALGLGAAPVVMWIGGFYPWHDLEVLLGSFAKVLHRLPQARLVLVGDGDMRPQVERIIAQNGLSQAVILTGRIAHARIPSVLSIADVAVSSAPLLPASSGGTGSPLKLFEYMAAGRAIVASRVSQAASVIREGHTGLLVDPGDMHGLADAITRLLLDPAERHRLGQNARREAVAHHSWERYAERLEAIYTGVV